MKVTWSTIAERELTHALKYIGNRNLTAAKKFAMKIIRAVARLERLPFSGFRSDAFAKELRCSVIDSYVAYYRVTSHEVQIVRFLHGSQDTTDLFDPI